MIRLRWESIDTADGVVEAATLRSMRIYVHSDGTWSIFARRPRRLLWESDHQNRGTSQLLGKQAVIEYIDTHFYLP